MFADTCHAGGAYNSRLANDAANANIGKTPSCPVTATGSAQCPQDEAGQAPRGVHCKLKGEVALGHSKSFSTDRASRSNPRLKGRIGVVLVFQGADRSGYPDENQ
jgi:hypothetical protein